MVVASWGDRNNGGRLSAAGEGRMEEMNSRADR